MTFAAVAAEEAAAAAAKAARRRKGRRKDQGRCRSPPRLLAPFFRPTTNIAAASAPLVLFRHDSFEGAEEGERVRARFLVFDLSLSLPLSLYVVKTRRRDIKKNVLSRRERGEGAIERMKAKRFGPIAKKRDSD